MNNSYLETMSEAWCTIHSDTIQSEEQFKNQVESMVGSFIDSEQDKEWSPDLFIYENPGYSEYRKHDFPDGFMFFRFNIDIEDKEGYSIKKYIHLASFILTNLWRLRIPSVAVCRYEDYLPLKGGYKSQWSCSPPKNF
ncbi:MAG: hypothetical protein HC921_21735 [Synechococcaceae cyanobacterium SM2_3_1]|nr:hypothetical protein [Synechococcaceae cyanobacterium SM2_3_1]